LALANALNASPAAFFAFDREERSEKVLRRRIDALLQNASASQLQQAYAVLKAFLEP